MICAQDSRKVGRCPFPLCCCPLDGSLYLERYIWRLIRCGSALASIGGAAILSTVHGASCSPRHQEAPWDDSLPTEFPPYFPRRFVVTHTYEFRVAQQPVPCPLDERDL